MNRTRRTAARVVATTVAAGLLLTAVPAQAASSIDTWSTWTGDASLQPFGTPGTPTYGQVLTIADGDRALRKVTWYLEPGMTAGSLVVRTGLATWDGSKAGTVVATSRPKTVDVVPGAGYEGHTFTLKKAKVRPGQQYVVMATISLDYEECTPSTPTVFPVHMDDPIPGGNSVWINDGGDESTWSTTVWTSAPTMDMAFKARFR